MNYFPTIDKGAGRVALEDFTDLEPSFLVGGRAVIVSSGARCTTNADQRADCSDMRRPVAYLEGIKDDGHPKRYDSSNHCKREKMFAFDRGAKWEKILVPIS